MVLTAIKHSLISLHDRAAPLTQEARSVMAIPYTRVRSEIQSAYAYWKSGEEQRKHYTTLPSFFRKRLELLEEGSFNQGDCRDFVIASLGIEEVLKGKSLLTLPLHNLQRQRVQEARPNDVVIYHGWENQQSDTDDLVPVHYGIYEGGNIVTSKWGESGPVFTHRYDHVPASYGQQITFHDLRPETLKGMLL